jgi:hypothetical protein
MMRKCRKKISHQKLLSLAKNSETAEKDNCAIVCRLVNRRTRRKKICHQSPLSPAKNSKNPRKGSSIKSEDDAFLSTLEATDVELLAKIVEPPSSKEVPDIYIVKYPEGLLESQNSETESSTAGIFMPNGVVLAETDDNSFGSQCVIFTGFWGQQPFQYGHYKLSSHSE